MKKIKIEILSTIKLLTFKKTTIILLGSLILTFTLDNIHNQMNLTEGGILGLLLLMDNVFNISPSFIMPIFDFSCFCLGYRYLGKDFLKLSIITTIILSFFFKLWESIPPVFINVELNPLLFSIIGGLLVGISVGIIIKEGSSAGGDDTLALIISKIFGLKLNISYLVMDFTILVLSLFYIELSHLIYSLITVIISSNIVWLINYHKE